MLPSTASAAVLLPLASPSAWPSTPIHATAPPGDARLFVVERGGGVRIVENGVLRDTPFLTVPNVDTDVERGLLSIAFDPDYASSGLLYVFTVAKEPDGLGGAAGDLRIVEYRRSLIDPNLADPASARLVLEVPHSAGNHNGGQLAFGPDGFLYVTIGDNAVAANAQDLANDLGKVLRIDPSPQSGIGFGVPPSNPFVGTVGARPEIFALGLRNPYRASFAPNGSFVVADVGQGTWEEINAGDLAGANLGWPICEGDCSPSQPGLTDPVFQYANASSPLETTGCAIVGGHVVRDQTLSGLTGRYLYGDFCRSDLRTINLSIAGGDPRPAGLSLPEGAALLGFGEDSGCRLYVLTNENAYRVAADATTAPSGGPSTCSPAIPISGPPSKRLRLRVRAPRRQKLRGYIKVTATCSEPCSLRAGGALLFFNRGAKAGSARLAPASRSARAGSRANFRLVVLKVKVRKRAKRALKHGRQVAARVVVSATDDSGNKARKRARVKLTR